MSIIFGFRNDQKEKDSWECNCTELTGSAHPKCGHCHGKGLIEIEFGIHEIHISNVNAFNFMVNVLGYDEFDYVGEIRADKLLQLCKEARLIYEPSTIPESYMTRFEELARAAAKAGDLVEWS